MLSLQRFKPSKHFVPSSIPKQMIYSVFYKQYLLDTYEHPARNGGQQTVMGHCESQMTVRGFPRY